MKFRRVFLILCCFIHLKMKTEQRGKREWVTEVVHAHLWFRLAARYHGSHPREKTDQDTPVWFVFGRLKVEKPAVFVDQGMSRMQLTHQLLLMVQSHPQNSIYIYLKKVDICVAKTWKTQQSAVLKSWNDQNRDTPMKPAVFRVVTREDANHSSI